MNPMNQPLSSNVVSGDLSNSALSAPSAPNSSLLAAGLISAGVATVGAIVNGVQNRKSRKQAEKQHKENMDFQKEQFNYQKYLNENQQQIMASDAQKAGINPLTQNGGSVQSTSFSGDVSRSQSNPYDLSALSNILAPMLQYKLSERQMSQDKDLTERQLSIDDKLAENQIKNDALMRQHERMSIVSDNINRIFDRLEQSRANKAVEAETHRHNVSSEDSSNFMAFSQALSTFSGLEKMLSELKIDEATRLKILSETLGIRVDNARKIHDYSIEKSDSVRSNETRSLVQQLGTGAYESMLNIFGLSIRDTHFSAPSSSDDNPVINNLKTRLLDAMRKYGVDIRGLE